MEEGAINSVKEKEGRVEEAADAQHLSQWVQRYNRALDTKPTCGGAMQSSLKRVRERQGSKGRKWKGAKGS